MQKSSILFPGLLLVLGIGLTTSVVQADPGLPGGNTTTTVQGSNAFSQPAANLSFDGRLDFSVGNSFFRNPWIAAPATTDARDGLGPLFNTNSCQGCHIKDGRGHPPEEGQSNLVSTLVRLSIPATAERPRKIHESVIAEPRYGDQAQDFAVPGITPEMRIIWNWDRVEMQLADGEIAELRKPRLEFTDLAHGDLHPDLMYSPRVAPAMIGLGLLEAIPEESIRAGADPDDVDDDGISGRPNEVWDQHTSSLTLGRFGWKAGKPTVEQQVAAAFFGDMGLSSSLNPGIPCSEAQTECRQAPNGGSPEVSDETMAFVTFYSSHLAVPARPEATDKSILAGQKLFTGSGCDSCHRPSWKTGDSESAALANQTIYPYTDMLLHDMGEGLADNRPEFQASGREWRTAPLWGLGDYEDVNGHTQLLHDGRARNITEAILWHGGEAADSRDNFIQLSEEKKQLLLDFLKSL